MALLRRHALCLARGLARARAPGADGASAAGRRENSTWEEQQGGPLAPPGADDGPKPRARIIQYIRGYAIDLKVTGELLAEPRRSCRPPPRRGSAFWLRRPPAARCLWGTRSLAPS
jgi:hypothetical protein